MKRVSILIVFMFIFSNLVSAEEGLRCDEYEVVIELINCFSECEPDKGKTCYLQLNLCSNNEIYIIMKGNQVGSGTWEKEKDGLNFLKFESV